MRPVFMMRLMAIILLLSGCIHHQSAVPVPTAHEKQVCKQVCMQQFERCQSTCDESCASCATRANEAAKKAYTQYHHERCVQGKTIIRRLQSYRDPLQCKKSSCDCPADYRMCVEACSGDIHKRLQVAPMCC